MCTWDAGCSCKYVTTAQAILNCAYNQLSMLDPFVYHEYLFPNYARGMGRLPNERVHAHNAENSPAGIYSSGRLNTHTR